MARLTRTTAMLATLLVVVAGIPSQDALAADEPPRLVSQTAVIALCTLLTQIASPWPLRAQGNGLGPRTTAEAWRVRGLEPALQALIEKGVSRSRTFRRLVAELGTTDVIVHLRQQRMPAGFRGFLMHHVLESNGVRYLRIGIDPRGADGRVIPLIAHELQHALEVARVPAVGRSIEIATFFDTIADVQCRNTTCSETRAAIAIQAAVRKELE